MALAFSLLIYCSDRASTLRRGQQRTASLAFRAASALAALAVLALIAYGLVLTVSKPK